MAINLVQTLDAAAASDTGTTQTRGVTWTSGNHGIIYPVGWISGGAPTVSSVEGSSSGTWTQAIVTDGTSNRREYIYYKENITGGSDTVTITWSGSLGGGRIVAQEWSGIAKSNSLDDTTTTNGGSSTTPTVALTPATDGCLYVGLMHHLGADGTSISVTTVGGVEQSEAEVFMSISIQSLVSTGSQSLTWSLSAGTFWQTAAACFKPSSNSSGLFLAF